ncbi:hypothetical protein OE88DRAFT_1657015 [Heliocybe sulcata]|uniref:Uncharacterized protein n=1 Tax=Heliocybe sulcata TaxID=5364 RepID=A0A5C3NAY3_9AGAM|nr:hypothetical protein OE88DRAFT_1657015 [Heliocybe sulcata]
MTDAYLGEGCMTALLGACCTLVLYLNAMASPADNCVPNLRSRIHWLLPSMV